MDNVDSLKAYGNRLIACHHHLLEMIDDLREGGGDGLAFCAALTRHHTGEDATVFPLLAAKYASEHPDLRGFLDSLARDHEIIAGMLKDDMTREELDGLTAVLETHFIGEEKRLVALLNALAPTPRLDGGFGEGS
ncbi:hemerythrin domain-containing protein [Paractinoplanes atraurantiacus]|uniref:hemerythrin domain-containing protein n=1 Tax=Paractinoplanes atraurantiacus TaxID=1036182 RepID=UPI001FE62501|nr:hemerythrin domain-containing protein [Actinoplanes atraurantiacus]